MAVRNKIFLPNEYYFLTFTILGWKSVFLNDEYCQLVYKWFDYCREKYQNKIGAYVIMPNHLHVIMKLTDKSPEPPLLIQNAKRFLAYGIVGLLVKDNKKELLDYFASNADKRAGAKHKIFEPRYDSLVLQQRKIFLEKLNYIHRNPCQEKWQLANCPEEYKYSSAANYILNNGNYKIDLVDF